MTKENNENMHVPTSKTKGEPKMDFKHESSSTKIYYYVDDQKMPYVTEVPIPPSKITLADFKKCINSRNYKFYYKVLDPVLNTEVKTDVMNDNEVLKPNSNGLYELFLLSCQFPPIPPLQPLKSQNHHHSHHATKNLNQKFQQPMIPKKNYFYDDSSSSQDDTTNLFADSNFCTVTSEDSQYMTSDFTSVSQQRNSDTKHYYNNNFDKAKKLYRTREKRKRPMRDFSMLSRTFDDTEASMALDIMTVTFNMDDKLPFGMSVISKKTWNYSGIYVHDISPGSLVALDGRIKPGYILLEVNGIPLDEYDPNEAIELLLRTVHQTVKNKGQLKLTFSSGDYQNEFMKRLIAEPVRPIDLATWVVQANEAIGLEAHQKPTSSMGAGRFDAALRKKEMPSTFNVITTQSQDKHAVNFLPTALTLIHNPSTEITSTSGLSSLTVSSVVQQPPSKKQRKKPEPTPSGGRKNRFSAVVRRLLCFPTSKNNKKKKHH